MVEEKNKKLEKIAWSFSHQVSAPIATIKGLANIFNYKNEFDKINKEVINKIKTPVDSLNKLVSNIVKDINNIN